MAVVSLASFRTEPGRMEDHLALTGEATALLRGMGLAAVPMQLVAGTDVGTIAMSVNYGSNADYVAALQKVQGDADWQAFYAKAMASQAAVQVESSIFADVDPNFQPDPDRPLGVILAAQWRVRPGRADDFAGNVMTAGGHIERLGGRMRAMQSMIGAHPMTMLVTTAFASLDDYGEYADKIAVDAEWQAFWTDVARDPSGELVRSGLYINISGD